MLVALEDVGITLGKHLRRHGFRHDLCDLVRGWPDVFQEDVIAVRVLAQRILGQVHAQRTCDGIGDDQRWRGKIVGLDVRADPAFEVTVARQHRTGDEIAIGDRFRQWGFEWTGITDTRRATISDEVEPERIEFFRQACLVEIVRDNLRARRKGCLHPGLAVQAQFARFLGHKASSNENGRVGRIRTRCNRRNEHVTMRDGVVLAFDRDWFSGIGCLAEFLRHGFGKGGVAFGQQDAILRTLRAGNRRHNCAKVKFQRISEDRLSLFRTPVALCLGIGLDEGNTFGVTAGIGEVFDGVLINREEATGRAIFRRHVGDRCLVFEGQVRQARAVEFDEFADDALGAQHLHNCQHEVGRCGAFCHLAVKTEADDFRDQHGDWLTQHGCFGFNAANAPTEHGEAVDHGRVRVGADAGVRIGNGFAVFIFCPDRLAQIFEVHLVADAGARWHNAEILERRGAPAQELIPFLVALVFDFDVLLEAVLAAEAVDHDRVVDDEVDRDLRVDRVC